MAFSACFFGHKKSETLKYNLRCPYGLRNVEWRILFFLSQCPRSYLALLPINFAFRFVNLREVQKKLKIVFTVCLLMQLIA